VLDPCLVQVPLPTFLLQPLVENAVKHGLRTQAPSPTMVRVSATRRGNRCVLEVRNDGRWVAEQQPRDAGGSGIGLANLRARLQEQRDREYAFSIGQVGGCVVARIKFHLPGQRPARTPPAGTGLAEAWR